MWHIFFVNFLDFQVAVLQFASSDVPKVLEVIMDHINFAAGHVETSASLPKDINHVAKSEAQNWHSV